MIIKKNSAWAENQKVLKFQSLNYFSINFDYIFMFYAHMLRKKFFIMLSIENVFNETLFQVHEGQFSSYLFMKDI